MNSTDIWTPRKYASYFMLSKGELFDWSNLLYLTVAGVVCMKFQGLVRLIYKATKNET